MKATHEVNFICDEKLPKIAKKKFDDLVSVFYTPSTTAERQYFRNLIKKTEISLYLSFSD